MVAPVTDEDILRYHSVVSNLARPFVGRAGAEFDDLYQEGMFVVITSLQRSINPSQQIIQYRMRNWVNKLRNWAAMEYPSGLLIGEDRTDAEIGEVLD